MSLESAAAAFAAVSLVWRFCTLRAKASTLVESFLFSFNILEINQLIAEMGSEIRLLKCTIIVFFDLGAFGSE